ncbi:MAG: glycosyltransferase [Methanobrevibacter sp.]|jgi:glycosyltransferase involved in cell wall biosynthesis|nr:glycosyltransferase [Candidatus Methanovirga meridionalis]
MLVNPKVSIIVPIYNVENYLEKCLNSIINQTLKDIEIICINDCSTDSSLKILNKYEHDERIIVINNKENLGLGRVRNIGISVAKGEYIGFVDSDDWIDYRMFEILYENGKKFQTDMTMSPVHVIDEKTGKFSYYDPYYTLASFDESFDNRTFNHLQTKEFFFLIPVMAFNKIYRLEFIKNFKFAESLLFEDNSFFYHSYLNAERVSLSRNFLYFYRYNRSGSITTNDDYKLLDIIKTLYMCLDIFKKSGYFDVYKFILLIDSFCRSMEVYKRISNKYKEKFFNLLKEYINNYPLEKEEKEQFFNNKTFKDFYLSKCYNDFKEKFK